MGDKHRSSTRGLTQNQTNPSVLQIITDDTCTHPINTEDIIILTVCHVKPPQMTNK
jgi:hypothetical protein